MNRTETGVNVRTTSTAVYSGWNLTFIHEAGTSNNVTCSGNNGQGGSLNASLGTSMMPNGGTNSNMSFNGIEHDNVVAKAIMDEMKLILTPAA